MASAAYTVSVLELITSLTMARCTQLADTATSIARAEGISREQIHQAIANARPADAPVAP